MFGDHQKATADVSGSGSLTSYQRRRRQTTLARRRRLLRLIRDFGREAGIASPTTADRAMLEQVATLKLQLDDRREAKICGEHVDGDELIRLSGEIRRVLAGLRKRAPAPKQPTLRERLVAGVV